MKLGCIIMAAGESRRFGGNKLAAVFQGKPLYQRALEAVPVGVFEQVVVVTGQEAIETGAKKWGFRTVENKDPREGVSRTIRLGLEALGDVDGALLMTADQPFLTRETIQRLVGAFDGETILAASHQGQRGSPCLFPRTFFSELLALKGDVGGGVVIQKHPGRLRLVEVPSRELLDVDTRAVLGTL